MSNVYPFDQQDLVKLAHKGLQLLDERRLDEWEQTEQTMAPDATFVAPGAALQGRVQIRQCTRTCYEFKRPPVFPGESVPPGFIRTTILNKHGEAGTVHPCR